MSAAPEFAQPASLPPTSEDYHALTIRSVHWWSPTLFSLVLDRPESFRFISGQFARLGLPVEGEWVWRAYSICSSVFDEHLEFLSIVVPNGPFTQALKHVQAGDTLYVDKRNFGTLTTDRFRGQKDLWMLATGTGLAPFMSILRDPYTWDTFEHVVLVHSVRDGNELAYLEWLENFNEDEIFGEYAERFRYVKVVTREAVRGAFDKRIPDLVESGLLEQEVGWEYSPERSAVMLCGNPGMLRQMKTVLQGRGLTVNKKSSPGNILWENGFLPEDNKHADL
ncbi:MAG TPA: ferredoxin--NADP reductase [Plasticicumulans sp.]|uniref:ferredoxin--NADP reductase n=1 Tax=Plasticicumulans sp. TaxID=2307179 RepID=UPI000FA9F928|nr:ferredoxin--NADP reductase [Plasticicumulans sp.]MBS0602668.1 ferredoxin--NADP reductase [Pseudomonadota bacterium]RTL04704.1 MAG: ferredoxin--NADP reductase [Xanthomonadales bacterium]HMV40530.1 ferredoxin--NADP reductase [Plasticicumulans sp.]HMW31410.1 ferredoxin--NADP reductase [Plasticicumulans sp.]HMW44065.1 ferredoxin--NADP reductase [Plasticicumulans sp.]